MSTVTSSWMQGSRRYQEDRSFLRMLENGWVLAVMDGHGGDDVAKLCASELEHLVPTKILPREDVEKLLKDIVSALAVKTRSYFEGSTLSMACVLEDRNEVVIAILGDSPVIVIDDRGKVHVSPEHNVRSNISELRAALARGGIINKGYLCNKAGGPGIQMSRALGDTDLDPILSREPEIYTVKKPRWVIVGSDGLLDPGHRESKRHIDEVVSMCRQGATAERLIQRAKELQTEDNVTALVWQTKAPFVKRKPGVRPKNTASVKA